MKLSIITVNKNNASGLERTIQSVINQTFKDFEYIIIDGASTDGSVDVIKKYQDKIDYWISEPDTGIYNAMNKGIKVAKGEYLLFLNSGDWLVDDKVLEKVFSIEFKEDIVYGDVKLGDYAKHYPDKVDFLFLLIETICHQVIFFKNNIFKKELYNEDFKIIADRLLLVNNFIEGFTFKHIPVVITNYDLNGRSSNKKELISELKSAIKKFYFDIFTNQIFDFYFKCKNYQKTLVNLKRSRIINLAIHLSKSKLMKKLNYLFK